LFWGEAGRLAPSQFPASWWKADELMGTGVGKVLFLPFHQYQTYPFSSFRSIGNPAGQFFRRSVIAGASLEFTGVPDVSDAPADNFLRFVVGSGPRVHALGALVAPLGVEYVVRVHAGDWPNYAWLDSQRDLVPVLSLPDLTVYRVLDAAPTGRTADAVLDVRDWGEEIAVANRATGAMPIVRPRYSRPGPIQADATATVGPALALQTSATSATSYILPRQTLRFVELPEPFAPGWNEPGATALPLDGGVLGFDRRGSTARSIRFRPWDRVRLLYALSVIGAVTLLVLAFRDAAGNGRRRDRGRVGAWATAGTRR
jgi:hypothetical protein